MPRPLTKDEFISKAVAVHGQLYDYSRSMYVRSNSKVEIRCNKGHTFFQRPNDHLMGKSCPDCASVATGDRCRKTLEQFVADGERAHSGFDYSQVDYKGDNKKVTLVCPVGHVFDQKAGHHIGGVGCPLCMKCGYNKGKPGALYLLRCDSIAKIGITNQPITTRIAQINRSSKKNFQLVHSILSEDGSLALSIEWAMKIFLASEYSQPTEKFDGSTECYYDADVNQIIKMINQHKFNLENYFGT